LPKDLKPVLKCDKTFLKIWQLFIIRNAILCKYSFPNLGGSMFVENWPQQEKSLQKNTAKITEAAEEQVFVSTYHQASINLCLFVDCIIESRICYKQMKEKCTMEW
jgi:hypothetical protein